MNSKEEGFNVIKAISLHFGVSISFTDENIKKANKFLDEVAKENGYDYCEYCDKKRPHL